MHMEVIREFRRWAAKTIEDLNELHNVAKDLLLLAPPLDRAAATGSPLGVRKRERGGSRRMAVRGGTAISAAFSSSSGGSLNVAGSSSVEQHNVTGGMAQGLAAASAQANEYSLSRALNNCQISFKVSALKTLSIVVAGGPECCFRV